MKDRSNYYGAMWALSFGVVLVAAAIFGAFFPDTFGLWLIAVFAVMGALFYIFGLVVLVFAAIAALISVVVAPSSWAARHEAVRKTPEGVPRTSADRRVDEGTVEAREHEQRKLEENQSAS